MKPTPLIVRCSQPILFTKKITPRCRFMRYEWYFVAQKGNAPNPELYRLTFRSEADIDGGNRASEWVASRPSKLTLFRQQTDAPMQELARPLKLEEALKSCLPESENAMAVRAAMGIE